MLLPRVMSTLNSGISNSACAVPPYEQVFNRPFWDDSDFRYEVLMHNEEIISNNKSKYIVKDDQVNINGTSSRKKSSSPKNFVPSLPKIPSIDNFLSNKMLQPMLSSNEKRNTNNVTVMYKKDETKGELRSGTLTTNRSNNLTQSTDRKSTRLNSSHN